MSSIFSASHRWRRRASRVPTQFAANRKVARGDVVVAEISAAFWEHPGQVLRSFALGDEPPPLYRELHAVADAAFDAVAAVLKDGAMPQQVIDAASVIEEAGFTIIDDLLHGYGGGYLPPVLGSRSRPSASVPNEPFRAGMTGRHPAQCRHARRQRRRADRRNGAHHRDRHRIDACRSARLRQALSGGLRIAS